MKMSRLNKIERAVRMWLAFMAMVLPLLSAQAETVNELLTAMYGDTITLAYTNSTTKYYLMAGSGNSVTAKENDTDTTALWKVYNLAGGFGCRLWNIFAKKWLCVSKPNGTYTFSLNSDSTKSTVLFINRVEDSPSPSYSNTGRGFASFYFWGDNGQPMPMYLYYDAKSNKPKWAGQGGVESFLRIEQWTRYSSSAYEITTNYSVWNLPFVDEEHAFSANQVHSNTYTVWLRTVSYLYCRPEGVKSLPKLLSSNRKEKTDAVRPTYYWESNKDSRTSRLTSMQFTNTGEIEQEEARDMVQAKVVKGANMGEWLVTMTPQGKSPINLRDSNRNYTDYTDYWVMTVSSTSRDEDEPASSTIKRPVVRVAGHHRQMDGLYASTSPTNYYFTTGGGTHTFQSNLTLITGKAIFGKDEQVLENPYANNLAGYVFSDTTQKVLSLKEVAVAFSAGEDTWVSAAMVGDGGSNTFTVRADANYKPASRTASLLSTYTYKDNNKTYSTTVQTRIYQAGSNETGKVKMRHQPGAGNTSLNNGMQAVHTVERTIYYVPDVEMELQLSQSTFKGYMRWYDYETGKDPMFDKDGNAIEKFWVKEPTTRTGNSNYLFKSINMDGKTSHGRYADSDLITKGCGGVGNETPVPNPTIKANWTKEQTVNRDGRRDIACDVSCYLDYTITDTAITEPTLSYRQIFHLRPAEEIAKQIGACTASKGNYFEVHHYTAPTGQPVHLSTNIKHYDNSNIADLCMFYYDTSGKLQRIGKGYSEAVWYKDNEEMSVVNRSNDNVVVESATAGTVVYDLRLPSSVSGLGEDLLLVRFHVVFAPYTLYGPTQQTLITQEEIAKNYDILAAQDFNFDIPGTTDVKYYNGHLPWDEATYGYVYPAKTSPDYIRVVNTDFPYYGEYTITNRVNRGTWAVGEQHGGAANGYCFYADGTVVPGLVTSVSTDAQICSGQQMYFSAWVCNPNSDGGSGDNPVFRFNVQGRNKENGKWTDWENVGQFYTGAIAKGGKWYQVKFPIISEKNYDESRVSIYNFAPTNSGNDFLVDDICLFASRLPLQAYQATTTCAEDSNEVIISRIDYTRLTGDWAGKMIYYQVYNTTADSALWAKYYRYGEMDKETYPDSRYGYICIPCHDYDPSRSGDPHYQDEHLFMHGDESKMVYNSVTQFIDSLLDMKENHKRVRAQKAYVKTYENAQDKEGRWVLYVGEIISKEQLKSTCRYEVRMAGSEDDLKRPNCALQAELSLNHQATFLFNGKVAPEEGVCANNLYPIEVMVTNQYVDDQGQSRTIQAKAYADWLVADRADDIFRDDKLKTQENIKKANAAFRDKYGYDRGKVEDAIRCMRQQPTDGKPNPNLEVSDAELLVTTEWMQEPWKVELLQDLAARGYLKLRQQTTWCYMTSEDTVRYWIFPISGTAEAKVGEDTITLNDCNTPSYMRICVNKSEYNLSLSPLPKQDMDEQQRGQLPGLRVSASDANKCIVSSIGECTDKVTGLVPDSCKLTDTNDPAVLEAMKKEGFRMEYANALDKGQKMLTLTPLPSNTDTMRAGYTYTMRVKMLGSGGVADGCEVGYSYFKVMVLPDTMIWSPTVSTEWGDDRNWRGIANGDTIAGYAPLAEKTNVVIPTMEDPSRYPYISNHNRYPTDANYTSHGCKDIQFCKNAILINQHLLDYKRAFVDMVINSARWYSVAAPLKSMYSGDFFIPHSGKYYTGTWKNLESSRPFEVEPFRGMRTSDAAYAFAVAYYNKSVNVYHAVDNASTLFSAKTAAFARSNAMNEELKAGTGLQVRGYGPGDDGEELVVRLPKQDATYYYFYTDGSQSSKRDDIPNRNTGYSFAFDPSEQDTTMTITLGNEQESEYFLFGNPTMAYIDMERFCTDNSGIQKMFQYMNGTTWITVSPNTGTGAFDDRLVAPMQSVLLRALSPATTLTLRLKPSHLTGLVQPEYTDDNYMPSYKPARAAASVRETDWGRTQPAVMDIALYTPLADYENQAYATAFAALATNSDASDDYVQDEDVPFLSSGIETADDVVVSPLNIYTLSGEQTLMADIRREISIIPIGMVVSDEIREDYDSLYLSFRLSTAWRDECYLCDNLTHARVPIWNDTRVKVPVPVANHEMRYYIEGPAYVSAGPDTPTDIGNNGNNDNNGNNGIYVTNAKVQVYTPAPQTVIIVANSSIQQVRIFDITGRPLITKSPFKGDLEGRKGELEGLSPVLTLSVPSGIAIVETTLFNGTATRTKLLVP